MSDTVPATLSMELAEDSKRKMNSSEDDKTDEWKRQYMESLINPFSLVLKNQKIFDGEIKSTAPLKLRATGEIVCSATLNTNIIIFPGLTNIICYSNSPNGNDNTTDPLVPPLTDPVKIDGTVFKQHLSTDTDRSVVRLARLTGAGARFFLTNSAEEDDGYWEACRVTNHISTGDFFLKTDSGGNLGGGLIKTLASDLDMANNSTYQFGQLRDMHKFVFKLNSEDDDHKFSPVSGLNTAVAGQANSNSLADLDQWDMIFIKVRGRRNVASPSVLRFDSVANQELVYSENSALHRMMDPAKRISNMPQFLEFSRVELPAYQAQL